MTTESESPPAEGWRWIWRLLALAWTGVMVAVSLSLRRAAMHPEGTHRRRGAAASRLP